jgi:predicted metal-dependent enzyme (double-stranded beta helix superfamily)
VAVVGTLRGAGVYRKFDYMGEGIALKANSEQRLHHGEIRRVSPRISDIHEVANASAKETAVSIHVYGGNVAALRRHDFDPATGLKATFASNYCNSLATGLRNQSPRAEPVIP